MDSSVLSNVEWSNIGVLFLGLLPWIVAIIIVLLIVDLFLLIVFHHKIGGMPEIVTFAILCWNEENTDNKFCNKLWLKIQRAVAYQYYFLFPDKY